MDKKKILAGTAMVALSGLAAGEAVAASANINIDAVVLRAIALAEVSPLDFGTFSATGAATIQVDPDGTITNGAGITHIGASTPNPAKVEIKASAGYPIDVSVGATAVSITSGANKMKVDTFDLATTVGAGVNGGGTAEVYTLAGVLGAAATASFFAGATLNVGAGQAAGVYSGTFVVNAAYQ